MKNIILVSLIIFPMILNAQTMSWVPSDKVAGSVCSNLTDCEKNIVCYQLQYTPKRNGVITSYTTGFFSDCDSGTTAIISNSSCLLTDNSHETVACENYSRVLFNASANTGSPNLSAIKKDEPIFLHQVCFELKEKKEVRILKETVTNLTVSIDDSDEGKAVTEFPNYVSYIIQNEQICNALESAHDIKLDVYSANNRVTDLRWTLAAETGIGKYIIERSNGGKTFENIGEVSDQSYNITTMKYTFQDEFALSGDNVYRITYVNGARDSEISNEVSIHYQLSEPVFRVFPNPTADYLNILSAFSEDSYQLSISSENGKNLLNSTLTKQGFTQLNLENFPAGRYHVLIEVGSDNFEYNIIVVK